MTPNELVPQVYDELRKLASAKLASETPGHTLDATSLVHEVFLKLGGERSFASQTDYLLAAAQAMRRILVDHARARNAAKRSGGKRVEMESGHAVTVPLSEDFEALDEALTRFAVEHPQMELVHLRYFGGLTLEQCAKILCISARTGDTWWAYARSWLSVEPSEN